MIKTNKENGIIKVTTPYNAEFVRRVKNLHGTWNDGERAWEVSEDAEQALTNLLNDVFGYSPESDTGETVIVQYNAEDLRTVDGRRDSITFAGIEIARRRHRDSEVSLHSSTFVVEGAFDRKGGSMGNPRIEECRGVILQTTLPRQAYDSLSEEIKSKMTVIEQERKDRKKELLEMEAKLMKQLEEVRKELENLM